MSSIGKNGTKMVSENLKKCPETQNEHLLGAWKNIVSADGIFEDVNSSSIGALNNVDATVKTLRVTIACESVYIRSATYLYWKK